MNAKVNEFWDLPDFNRYKAKMTLESRNDIVITKAGRFNNCLRFFFDAPSLIDEETWYWFAPDIGIIKEQGAWSYFELYYAKVNNVRYPGMVSVKDDLNLPKYNKLYLNYPNSFNPETTIKYDITKGGKVNLVIFDILGREIRTLIDEEKEIGSYEIKFKAKDLPSGLYHYKIVTDDQVQIKKMVMLK